MPSSKPAWTSLALGAALLLGAALRLAPTLTAGFPLNDGGMFLDMSRDLRAASFRLPDVTAYNLSDIPYAYPPLGFYLAAALTALGVDELAVLRFLPALASTAAIVGLYLLAGRLRRSPELGAVSALLYAVAPRAYTWLVMGGGLTRALGFGLIPFLGWALVRLFQDRTRKWLWTSMALAALIVLSHPEASVHAVWLGLLLWSFHGRTRASFLDAVGVALGTLVLTSPWWGTLLKLHGLAPLLSAANTGVHGIPPWSTFWRAIWPADNLVPILSGILVAALGWGLGKRQFLLVCWALGAVLVEPRSALNVLVMPLSILAAGMAMDVGKGAAALRVRRPALLGLLLLVYLFFDAYLYGFRLANTSLVSEERTSLAWLRENTPSASQFILLTGLSAPELDAFQEWFPALADRRSLTTFQGTEWLLGPQFFANLTELRQLQACQAVSCIRAWALNRGMTYDFIVARKRSLPEQLTEQLRSSPAFELFHEDPAILVLIPR